jgi:hypothetical protein
MAPQGTEVLMLAREIVRQLAEVGWRSKKIARQLGVAGGTVRRYLGGREQGLVQRRSGRGPELSRSDTFLWS